MTNRNVITNSAEFGLIPQRSFFDKDIAVEGNTEKYYIIEQGDFVYNPRKSTTAPYGPFNCYQGEVEGIVSPLYTCLKPLHKEFTNYLLWYFRSSAWYSYIYHNGAQGGARHDRVGMTNELMDGIPVNLPCLKEQEKVSKFLSLVEQRIAKQRLLVEALKSYKRGALSKLFPKKGETTPEYRFAGFTEPWERRKLGEIGEIMTGSTPSTQHQGYYSDDGIPWVTPTDIVSNLIKDTAKRLSLEGAKVGRVVPENTVLVTCIASIGKNALLQVKGSFNQQINSLTPYKDYDSYFLLTESELWSEKMKRQAAAATMQIVNKTEFSELDTMLPLKEEQEKIGSFFRYLDNLITLHQRKLSEFDEIKAGLLQQLFI